MGSTLEPEERRSRLPVRRVLQVVVSLAVVGAVFFFALPQFADYSEVWAAITAMTPIELLTLSVAALWNLISYWPVMVNSLPGLNYWQAMKVNLTSTAIANTLPGGGALGIGVTSGMYTGYGFTGAQIGSSIVVSGVWNNFVKLGMPVIALTLLAIAGQAGGALVTAALIGVAVLVGAVFLLGLVLRSRNGAEAVGRRLDSVWGRLARVRRRPPRGSITESLVRFRTETVGLLHSRWPALTVATLVSHFSLFAVLLISLRHVGVSNDEVSWQEALAAFCFVRLLTALPITPGGLGVVELGATAALIAAGGDRGQVVAAVLVYRAATYLPPIPLGLAAYAFWRKGAKGRAERVAARLGKPSVTADEPRR
jgi:putative heme transporter